MTLALSFHATKAFGIGEGGGIATTDPALAEDIRTITNFGLDANRVARLPGMNAKMSEYAAAVGLALLDHWPEFRIRYSSVLSSYRKHFAPMQHKGSFWLEPNWITTYPHVITRSESERDGLIRVYKVHRSKPAAGGWKAATTRPPMLALRGCPFLIPTSGLQLSWACPFRSTSTKRKSAISPARQYSSCRMLMNQAAFVY